jgi:hypothetical protein
MMAHKAMSGMAARFFDMPYLPGKPSAYVIDAINPRYAPTSWRCRGNNIKARRGCEAFSQVHFR